MSRFTIVLIIVVSLVLGGLAYYQHSRLAAQLDVIAGELQPYGELSYGAIRPAWFGGLRVHDLVFVPAGGSDQIQVDRLSLRSASWNDAWDLQRDLAAGRPPAKLDLSLHGIRVPLDGDFYPRLMELGIGPGLGFEAAGCEERQLFGQTELANMGFVDVHGHLDMQLEQPHRGGEARLDISLVADELNWWRLQSTLPSGLDRPDLAGLGPALLEAQMADMHWSYEDLGFYAKAVEFCAETMGISPGEYRDRHVSAWVDAWQAAGFSPGAALSQAYAAFMEQPGQWHLKFPNQTSLPLALIPRRLSPDQQAESTDPLEADIWLDEESRTRIDLAQEGPLLGALLALLESDQAEPVETVVEDVPEPPRDSRRFRPVGLGELENFEGYWIHLTLSDGREREGRLLGLDGAEVQVEQRLSGGYLVIPFSRSNITEVQVLH